VMKIKNEVVKTNICITHLNQTNYIILEYYFHFNCHNYFNIFYFISHTNTKPIPIHLKSKKIIIITSHEHHNQTEVDA